MSNGIAALAERLYVSTLLFTEAHADHPSQTDWADLTPAVQEAWVADAALLLSDGSRFLSREAAERQEAIEKAARALFVEVAAYGLRWDEEVEGCRFCESPTDEHEPWCKYAALREALERAVR